MKNDPWMATNMMSEPEIFAEEPRSPLLDATVMMVDDEPLMTDLIQTHLEDVGYRNFLVANDPLQALALLRRAKPSVLLLDLLMPGMSGFELLEAMRADSQLRYVPVIVLTAATGAAAKLRALQLGATDFLSKPVDASELVLRVRNTLAFQQYHDRLIHYDRATGLPNDRLFEKGVDALLSQPLRPGLLALFSIAVPECGQLREGIGRNAADTLSCVVAQRLEQMMAQEPPCNVYGGSAVHHRVARLGEQHFGLVLDGVADAARLERKARAIISLLAQPVDLGTHEVVPTPRLGIALAPGDGLTAAAMRQSADLAASHTRGQGSMAFEFASPELNAKSYQRLMLGAQLRGAAQRGELRLHYQPKVAAASGRTVGVEALVRWQHPDGRFIQPLDFVSLAEELGLMPAIGQWVIEQACRDAMVMKRAGLGEIAMSVNVSKVQFESSNLDTVVYRAMADSGLPARQLVIELTESMLMDDVDASLALMHTLKRAGVTLSIDDFGTGYSSLAYLKRFPLDELKIDRSFVMDLPGRHADVALVRTVIDLGHCLGMSVTAEGVETQEQLACLRDLGCDTIQGFYFSRPLPLPQLMDFMRQRMQAPVA